jgi:hypothetical protein
MNKAVLETTLLGLGLLFAGSVLAGRPAPSGAPDSIGIPYSRHAVCEQVGVNGFCYFDVPAGKILRIERITGFARAGNVTHLVTQTPIDAYLIPETSSDGVAYLFEEYGPIYASDTNGQVDSNGVQRDFRILVFTDGSSTSGLTGTRAFVIGQLFDEL